MENRFEDIRLLPDINKTDDENSILNYSKAKKITALGMISILGVIGGVVRDNDKGIENSKVDKREIELVDYNLAHAYSSVNVEFDNKTARLEIKIDKTSDEYLKRVAQECDLTLIDPDNYIDKLSEAKDFNESINCLNEYAANFGFQFSIIDDLDATDMGNGLDSRSVLDENYISEFVILDRFKQTASTIMHSLGYTPVEFISVSKLKEVRLLKAFPKERPPIAGYSGLQVVPAAIALENEDLVYFSISSFGPWKGPEIFFHEVGHLIDGQQMGDLQQSDPQYTSLNPADFEYFDEQSYTENKDAVVDEYASLNVIEDKGMIYQNFIFGPRLAYSNDPIIRQKTRLLVVRLEKDIPNISKYYAALCDVAITDINK